MEGYNAIRNINNTLRFLACGDAVIEQDSETDKRMKVYQLNNKLKALIITRF